MRTSGESGLLAAVILATRVRLASSLAAHLAQAAQATLVIGVLSSVVLVGCSDRRIDDDKLGGLVVPPSGDPVAIDVNAAASNIEAFREALATPHSIAVGVLGAHEVAASSSVRVTKGGVVVTDLSDKTIIRLDANGNYLATADNNSDYGRHAIFVDEMLYLRPRYGKYHRRAPANRDEPNQILDQMHATSAAYFELLFTGAELSDRGNVTAAGRAARQIDIKLSPNKSPRPKESLSHRRWRESISVDQLTGTVILDSDSGIPLKVSITGELRFVKDQTPMTMKLAAEHEFSSVGEVAAIERPSPDLSVSAPTISNEASDERTLLDQLNERKSETIDTKKSPSRQKSTPTSPKGRKATP